jgi:deoxyribonuclease V
LRRRWRHDWNVTPAGARRIQLRGVGRVVSSTSFDPWRLRREGRIAAGDVAYDRTRDFCFAALVLWDIRGAEPLAEAVHAEASPFPYVPGLLSFREIPPLLPLLRRLKDGDADLLLCDGQGVAHPRRFGLASHLGVIYDLPSLGWAKSRLIGTHGDLPPKRGAATQLMDGEEQIGWVLRSREACNPTYVSPGHRVSMSHALEFARSLLGEHRLCEAARRAHHLTTLAMKGRA